MIQREDAIVDRGRTPSGVPALSVVVVVYDMVRELPRTLHSLAPAQQIGVDADQYEVIVVDNGSPQPVDSALLEGFPGRLRSARLDPAPPSPARAANVGLELAQGSSMVGLIIDGARMASPGLLRYALAACRLARRPVVTAPGYHLGDVPHMQATEVGYDQAQEDDLLDASGWREDGYRLFARSVLAGSSARGWFGPMGESSSLFMPRALWDELGGLDERFDLPGGGLVNHDLYRRACAATGVELVSLLGEGTFHQYHGGAATSRRFGWDEMHAQYEVIVGSPHEPPQDRPLHVGRLPISALPHAKESVDRAIARAGRRS